MKPRKCASRRQPCLPWNASHYRYTFQDIRTLAAKGDAAKGLPAMPSLADFRDHDLRDTAVTSLARADATVPEIAAITGHSIKTVHSILKHYLALDTHLSDSAIAKLEAYMKAVRGGGVTAESRTSDHPTSFSGSNVPAPFSSELS